MSVDYSKLTYDSANMSQRIISSGTVKQDISGTYTSGILATTQLAAAIDLTSQYVYMFGTGDYTNTSVPFELLPDSYSCTATVAGVSQACFTDVYYYVDSSNNLQLRFNNTSFSGSFAVTVPAHIQIAWYLVEVSPNI